MSEYFPLLLTCMQAPSVPDGFAIYYLPDGGDLRPTLDVIGGSSAAQGMVKLPPPPDGHVWVFGAYYHQRSQIRALPALPEGERYVMDQFPNSPAIPDWCFPACPLGLGREGPSRFACDRNCLYADGCARCNGSMWLTCLHGSCIGEQYYRVPAERIREGMPCPCERECDRCDRYQSPYRLEPIRDMDGDSVGNWCSRCTNRYATCCSHCDSFIIGDEYESHEMECSHGCTCSSCYDDEDHRHSLNGLIHDYSYTPHLSFHGDGPYHMGLELEVDTGQCHSPHDAAESVTDHWRSDFVYLKEDSSVEGFEIVTHPMTFEYAMGSVDWSIVDRLRTEHDVRATRACGMHIHVSRTAFQTVSHTYRWMRFIYRNADEVQALARRKQSSYASFSNQMNAWSVHWASVSKGGLNRMDGREWYLHTTTGIKRGGRWGLPYHTERYSAINVENPDTFELRFFASTTRSEQVKAALAFVHASIEYTRQLTAHKVVTAKGLDFATFREWVAANNESDHYSALIAEMNGLVN